MVARRTSELFSLGRDILSSTVSAGQSTILLQTGDAVAGEVEDNNVELYQQAGLWSRPAKATPGLPACQGVMIRDGGRDVCIAQRDTRANNIYGNLGAGETCVGASTGPNTTAPQTWARTVYKGNGSINHLTTDSAGNTMLNRLTPTEWRFFAPWGTQLHDSTGYHVRTWHGAKLDLGGLGLPSPFNSLGLNSTATLTADVITLDAAILHMGRDSGDSGHIAKYEPLLAKLAAIEANLSAINTAIQALALATAAAGFAPSANPIVGLVTVPGTVTFNLAAATSAAVAIAQDLLIAARSTVS